MAKRVLVVGGAGYIGSHCCRLLEDRGDEVVVFDDLSTGHRGAVRSELIVGDIRDPAALRAALRGRGFDAVMHFAARAMVGESMVRPSLYFALNVGGTANLLDAMRDADVPAIVFSSTCAIYGAPQTQPVDETHPKGPLSPYGLSKLQVEQMLETCRALEGLRASSLRYFNAAGAHPDGSLGESHDPETHLIPLALAAAMGARPPLEVFGDDYDTPDGTCIRDYVHVMDLASAHALAMDAMLAGSPGGAWNLGSERGHSVLQVLESVARVTGRPVPHRIAPRRAGDPPALYASSALIRAELGWTPQRRDLDGIIETAWRWARSPRW
ncbi:UDP-glucose 4-epimerase GalE [Myxococcota bacterium]|nr:UDP-glucose 4-epimerase GalE [Myxococcota bacterium]